jgi:hypothetical protein
MGNSFAHAVLEPHGQENLPILCTNDHRPMTFSTGYPQLKTVSFASQFQSV